MYFDPDLPNREPSWAIGDDAEIFTQQQRDAKEQILPEHMTSKARGRLVTADAFVDSSHASNKVTKRSHNGFVIFINRTLIIWQQNPAHFKVN